MKKNTRSNLLIYIPATTDTSAINVLGVWAIPYYGVGTLVPIDGIIDSRKYVEVLDMNLWPVVCKYFAGRPWIFQDDNAPVHRSFYTRQWKTNRMSTSSPGQHSRWILTLLKTYEKL